MSHSPFWPEYLPRHLVTPDTTVYANLEISRQRHGGRTAIGFFGRDISYHELFAATERLAAWLHHEAGLAPGARVALFMQNCPQWLMAYYGVVRANAVVVPVNPMNRADELRKILADSGAEVVICAQELAPVVDAALEGTAVRQRVMACYADYLPDEPVFELPAWLATREPAPSGYVAWCDALAGTHPPPAFVARPDDILSINYTSGSTGRPKGCVHTHRSFLHTTVGLCTWHGHPPGTVFLGVGPMYQVSGLMHGVLSAVYLGGTVVPMPRWDRRLAAQLIEHYRVHFAGMAPTAVGDLVSDPELERYDLASLRRISAGGSTMPDAVWQRVQEKLGLSYIEAYGLTETAATTHINPVHRPKRQCLGIAFFDTLVRVVHPETLQPCAPGEAGELVMSGPQLFQGYWGQPEATADAFFELDGVRYFRSGDIGHVDDEGYFFMTDRLKRMINASGFKVWPAEVETLLYGHPDVQEACVIGTRDPYRGETVKAVVALRAEKRGQVPADDIIAWARERMAAYKYPRVVEFVDALPKSPVGKILWNELQDAENRRLNS
ncbi:MAG: long-chain-fatty-acid--CoA ligase [Pigmentiphaga sp.]